MTEDEFVQYWEPACMNLFNAKQGNYNDLCPYAELDKLLSVREYRLYRGRYKSDDKPMCKELRRKVALLAGPHWRAVLIANNIPIPEIKHG